MRIGTNILALKARTQLTTTQSAIGRALQRLASGKRINSARDDASGLARANGLEAEARGLRRAVLNANESVGVLATADGTMATITEIVQRMRELALQSANGILTSAARSHLNSEFQSLYDEYTRLIRETNFNGVNLLDGSFGTRNLQVGASKGDTIDFGLDYIYCAHNFNSRSHSKCGNTEGGGH